MSSALGPRAVGSDGADFLHRERIATHYKTSATNKSRLKCATFLHFALILLMLFRLSTSILVLVHLRPPSLLQKLRLPRAQMWEYWWLASVLPAIISLAAIRKNRAFLMKHYLLGIFTFGLLPVLYAVYDMLDDMVDYWETREAKLLFQGFPVVVLWNMFLVICLQLHLFSLYSAWQLIKAWRPVARKKVT